MKILKIAVIAVCGLLVLLLLMGLFLPAHSHVERSILIERPPEQVHDFLANMHHFNAWSPWASLDPEARYEVTGTPGTPGHRFTWISDRPEVGSGSQTITAVQRPERIDLALVFEPDQGGEVSYLLEPVEPGTRMTWSFDTELSSNPLDRWFGVFLDSMLGPSYEQGLQDLKTILEEKSS